MKNRMAITLKPVSLVVVSALLLMMTVGCAKQEQPGVKKIAAGQEDSGFLKDYTKLKPVPDLEGAKGYASTDAQKNLRKYIACVVDPVEVYLASDADGAKMTETARSAVSEYFRAALVKSVSSAYPVVEKPGPLVLRLRAAVVGVDLGGEVSAEEKAASKETAITHKLNIGKVQVEMELVDSETGEQIAALVDKEKLGESAEITSAMSRDEKWAAAREAFDGWAARVRRFLNASHEMTAEEAEKADKSYAPYGSEPAAAK
jgi:hypothetical protein